MAVTGEKFAQAEGLRGVAGAEKDQAPVAAADEFEAAEDESAHENFAELGVFGDERAEGAAGEFGETAGTMDGDGAFAVEARLHNFHAAGKDDEERDVGVADIEKNFVAVDVPDVALRANPIDLRWSESRKNLRARIKRAGYRRCSHFLFLFIPALWTGLIRVHSGQKVARRRIVSWRNGSTVTLPASRRCGIFSTRLTQ